MKFSVASLLRNSLAVLIVLTAACSHAFAISVPEIDTSVSAGALALLGGAILLVRGRRRR